ncbi:putative serine hydrolase [Brevipalpus obovatus]|uniref:putative serine hydrolase n=1 Tax=Brevipalpus obovatus TaxID=246614 RepID=UPI003D9F4668
MKSDTREVRVPAGYGSIAVKEWGEKVNHHATMIALHGWMDNCSTFDPLIECLTGDYHILGVDLPGHGLSSHYPPGVPYRNLSWIIDIRRVVKHFQLDKVIFLGHSLGAALSLLYASIYPEEVEKIISCDIIKEATFEDHDIPKAMAKSLDLFLDVDRRPKTDRGFSREQAIQILIGAHTNGDISPKMAGYLLRRASVEKSDGLHFTRDGRLMGLVHQKFRVDDLINLYSQMKCDLLILRGNSGTANMDHPHTKRILEVHKQRGAKIITLLGDHYFHLSHPKETARHVEEFLNKTS